MMNHPAFPEPRVPLTFKLWMGFIALTSLGVTGFGIWAVYRLVIFITGGTP